MNVIQVPTILKISDVMNENSKSVGILEKILIILFTSKFFLLARINSEIFINSLTSLRNHSNFYKSFQLNLILGWNYFNNMFFSFD